MHSITPLNLRKIILEQSRRAHVGHIGSALSVVEIIAALYGTVLNIPGFDDPNRDRFVLSKGHAALALYAALHCKGWIGIEQLNGFHTDGTLLGVHPERDLPGIEFSTGSLGLGLSYSVGLALAGRISGSPGRVFALVSDAECNEGIVWEALMFAGHNRLSNLYVLIDRNGQQALGYTRDIMHITPLADKWASFNWDARTIDGHDVDGIVATIADMETVANRPHVIVAETTFGKGVSFMENKIKWHYTPMTDDEYVRALDDIERCA